MENSDQSAKRLWEKFLIVSEEMLKFLERKEIDMFLELMEQRIVLQKQIEALANETYHLAEEGKLVIRRINSVNMNIRYQAQLWLNTTKKTQSMARAYDSLGYEQSGFQLNRHF